MTFSLIGRVSSPELDARLKAELTGGPAVTPDELRRLTLDAMPPHARTAYLEGEAMARGRTTLAERERAADAAHRAGPQQRPLLFNSIEPVAPPRRTEGTMLTIEQQNEARQLIAAMAQPLNADEKKICRLTGVSEEAYLKTRNDEIAQKLPGGSDGLDPTEREACRLLGMTPAAFREAQALEAR